jgi:hypothetical protein
MAKRAGLAPAGGRANSVVIDAVADSVAVAHGGAIPAARSMSWPRPANGAVSTPPADDSGVPRDPTP